MDCGSVREIKGRERKTFFDWNNTKDSDAMCKDREDCICWVEQGTPFLACDI